MAANAAFDSEAAKEQKQGAAAMRYWCIAGLLVTALVCLAVAVGPGMGMRCPHTQHDSLTSNSSNDVSSDSACCSTNVTASRPPRQLLQNMQILPPRGAPVAAPALQPGGAYLAVCVVVKDQHKDVREWLDWNLALGVGRIYLFDNNSSTPMLPHMADLVATGAVSYTFFATFSRRHYAKPQLYAYSRCIANYASQHRWMAFIDADEFFVIKDGSPDLPTLLREYEDFGGLAVNWQMFGSSGHLTRPRNSTVRAYTACLPADAEENRHVKTIANLRYVLRPIDPHHFSYRAGTCAVNTDSLPIHGPRSPHVVNSRLILNHYVVKSLGEYRDKMQRGSAMGNQKTIHFFDFIEAQATDLCIV